MIVYLCTSSPNWKVTVDITHAPLTYLLAVSASDWVDVDQTQAEGHFHLFFAMLALESQYKFYGRRMSIDNSVGSDLLNAISWFSLWYAENWEEMLLAAVKNTLSIRHVDFKTVSCLLQECYFLCNGVVIVDFLRSKLAFHDDAFVINCHLQHRAATYKSLLRIKESCALALPVWFGLSYWGARIEIDIARFANRWLFLFLGVVVGKRCPLGVWRLSDRDLGLGFGWRCILLWL